MAFAPFYKPILKKGGLIKGQESLKKELVLIKEQVLEEMNMNTRSLGILMALGGLSYLAYYLYTNQQQKKLLSYVEEQTEKETMFDAGFPGSITMVA